ncbi:NAD(P)/FAD-dependent oxidoreductase [Shinella sp. G-2]|uniref:NAD(P)/FAD-dependent oxidoreductase n=1 Tax=Shinella sp. G-2 TaxID=3133141 RepID=UPI003D043785
MSYPDTYYKRTMADQTARPALAGTVECDVVIVGGGLAGLSTALQLARAGKHVTVLEAESVGFGASGRNGGFVGPGYATGGDDIARITGKDAARKLHHLSIEGMEFIRENIKSLGIDSARPEPGIMSVLRYDDGPSLKAYADETRREYGYDLDYMDRDAVRAVLKSERYFQALRNPNAFHMHPLNYLRAIAAEIERLGGRICEQSPATSVDFSRTEKRVKTAGGEVRAHDVVFTTGGYTDGLNGRLKRSFLPIATYVMVSEEAPELIATAIATENAIGDNRRAGDYYRLVDGGRRILWGGRITTHAASTAGLVKELRAEMIGTYPQLRDLRTELAWSGLMSYARHLMPQIGRMSPGVWYCTAFGGHGLNTTAIGGKVIAEGILGESDRYRLFEPFGLVWAGGLAGLAVAQLTYWKLQAQDWWRERAA